MPAPLPPGPGEPGENGPRPGPAHQAAETSDRTRRTTREVLPDRTHPAVLGAGRPQPRGRGRRPQERCERTRPRPISVSGAADHPSPGGFPPGKGESARQASEDADAAAWPARVDRIRNQPAPPRVPGAHLRAEGSAAAVRRERLPWCGESACNSAAGNSASADRWRFGFRDRPFSVSRDSAGHSADRVKADRKACHRFSALDYFSVSNRRAAHPSRGNVQPALAVLQAAGDVRLAMGTPWRIWIHPSAPPQRRRRVRRLAYARRRPSISKVPQHAGRCGGPA